MARLTPELEEQIAEAIAVGVPQRVIAQGLHVSHETVSSWCQGGNTRGFKPNSIQRRIAQRQREFIKSHIDNITAHSKKWWQASVI